MSSEIPCPACGIKTVEDNYGSYIICSICGWEDDNVQLGNPCSKGGANGCSLAAAQEEILKVYPLDVSEVDGIKRSKHWRPLNRHELEEAINQLKSGPWPNIGVLYENGAYWRKNS